jgi:hypothetical protein
MRPYKTLGCILLICVISIASIEAYPELWVSSLEDLVTQSGQPGCNDHPLFGTRYGRHGAVTVDTYVKDHNTSLRS